MDTICPALLCKECRCEAEIIVDRTVEGEIVRFGQGRMTTNRPTTRSDYCYYHNKKRRGRFDKDWETGSGLFNIRRKSGTQRYTRK